MSIKKGSIIKAPNWPEPVEVKNIEEFVDHVSIVGATMNSRTSVDDIISRAELETFEIIISNFTEEPWKAFLSLETIRYRFATLYDPLLAMNISKVDPLPHQIEAVYGYVLKQPRIRFLIADDPGAGKTIMAGLIIKELKLRHLARRILIVAPGHLKDQWRRELKDRFEEHFLPVDRNIMNALYGENIWTREPQLITSIDFAKQDSILPTLAGTHFDLIIVDEAHKMSAYRYGNKVSKSDRYRCGEALSQVTEHLLFLTATPHKGDPDNYRLFMDLLVKGFFATNEMIEDSKKSKDNPLFIRRMKEDLRDFEGKPLFLKRHVITRTFRLGKESERELDLYNELSNYVIHQYNKALTKEKTRNIAFALVILQRRLASSTYALLKSLERRQNRLEEYLKEAKRRNEIPGGPIDYDAVDDMSEEDRWEEEELWETLSVAENREELKFEIETIKELIVMAKVIINREDEIKLRALKEAMDELRRQFTDPKDKKILIFTESRDTLDYLENKLRGWGYSTNCIHGGMKLEDRITAEKVFKNETEVLIATEAAGEGINLQFCHLMINYDIPWNPNRLEQRMGRIHRYGQKKEVHIFNLVAEDTREGSVFARLFRKLDEIRNALGSDKVFDCLGECLIDTDLSQLLREAAANAKSRDDVDALFDNIKVDEKYIAAVKENLGESLATHFIDYTRIKEMAQKAREYRLIPEYTQNYFQKAFEKAGGRMVCHDDGFVTIDRIPFPVRKIGDDDLFKKTFGSLLKRYPQATFDKETAFDHPEYEFISFGHPLFEAVMRWVEDICGAALLTGSTFVDPDGRLDGYLLFYEAEIRDGTQAPAGKRLFSLLVNGDDVKPLAPSIIWDLEEAEAGTPDTVDIESLKSRAYGTILPLLEEYKAEIAGERERHAAIKEKYGVKSLEYLIGSLDSELIDLHVRKERGVKVDLTIRNKEEQKREYEHSLDELLEQIGRERRLTMTRPRFVGILRIRPAAVTGAGMRRDDEVERIAMDVAMEYERSRGRKPEDVGKQNLGFDIRSFDSDGNPRYIEVKGRAGEGGVELTRNEWFKAHRFGDDYYLFYVANAKAKPELHIVRNPAINLSPTVKIVRYIVSGEELRNKGHSE